VIFLATVFLLLKITFDSLECLVWNFSSLIFSYQSTSILKDNWYSSSINMDYSYSRNHANFNQSVNIFLLKLFAHFLCYFFAIENV
jgi:hypothetical protein